MTTDQLRAAIEALRTALEEAITWPSSGTLQHAQANWRIAAAEYDALDAAPPAPGLDETELQALFDLRYEADMRAIKMWQAAHPGNDLVWPDHADLVVWLLEQLDEQA